MVSVFDKKQKTVKAFETDIVFINERAKGLDCTAAEVIHVMCEDFKREVYLQELGDVFDLLRSDEKRWAKFEAEHKA